MSAVIRMKRHISEAPHSAFILNCKKQKLDDPQQTPIAPGETSTVLKFAGTVNQGEDISEHLAKITKEEAKDIVTKKTQRPDTNLKSRIDQNKEKSQQNRFKIVNCTRALNETEDKSSNKSAAKGLTIVDVEKDREISATQATAAAASTSALVASYSDISDEPFVYDIYVAESSESYPDSIDLNDLSILEYNDYLYSQPRLVNSDSEEEEDVEDEDSNDENNWRNDYPEDEELSDNESIGERQMRRAMNNFKIENELSSDYEEDNVGYTPESYTFDYEDDADRYGEAYADFKKRVLRDSADSSIAESNEFDPNYQPGMNTSFNSFIDSD